MNFRLKKILTSDWMIGLFLLGVFLATNGYTYGWDDQHLEIPLLKSLINPSLYPGDYYVESLKQNFSSLFFPVLSRFISVQQIPLVYFLLFLIARYFLFFWMYKIWKLLSGSRLTGILCTLAILLVGRVEEFLYRTFSHQEFALAIIFAGIYYFYRNRFILAAVLLGLAANVHALYSLFPFLYLIAFLFWYRKEYGWGKIIKSIAAFGVCALPLFIQLAGRYSKAFSAPPVPSSEWIALYKIACPQNFLFQTDNLSEIFSSFKTFLESTFDYWRLLLLFLLNFFFNPSFRKDKKSLCLMTVGVALLLFSFIFSYIWPIRFVLDLNLIRNTQFMLFVLMGYSFILARATTQTLPALAAGGLTMALFLFRFGQQVNLLATVVIIFLLAAQKTFSSNPKNLVLRMTAYCSAVLAGCGIVFFLVSRQNLSHSAALAAGTCLALVSIVSGILFFVRQPNINRLLRQLYLPLILTVLFSHFVYYHVTRHNIETRGLGLWQLQRSWIDMQNYVREHTPPQALLMTPYDMEMGGFRIFSERKVLVCYRDCGIIGFDYEAAKEWQRRIKDIEAFQVYIRQPIDSALFNAIQKYRVNYIVFMRYSAPNAVPFLKLLYENDVFVLYRVLVNPIPEQQGGSVLQEQKKTL